MSLLEDVFLEDEAGEAQELERIIEGDEYDERPQRDSDSDDNSEKEDEAEEDKRRVDPASTKTKRVVKNPRFVLNPARLTGPRGIQVIPEHFKDFKFKGKGYEKEDLDLVLKKLEHWAYRLYPKFQFEDCLKKIETLGKKRPVMVHLHKIRSDQLMSEETVVQKDSSDDELAVPLPQEEDEFDKLLQQQIELARNTPAPGSVKKGGFETPGEKRSSVMMPKATSSPSISDDQKERMMRSRKLAEERRLARLKANSNNSPQNLTTVDLTQANRNETTVIDDDVQNMTNMQAKKNRSNVIDSSDEENEVSIVRGAVNVDIHINGKDNDTETANNDIVKAKKNKSSIIDSSDNDDEVAIVRNDNHVDEHLTSEDADTVSVNKNELRSTKKNNFVDSSDSDEENEMSIVEEAIDVEIHRYVKDVDSEPSNKENVRSIKKTTNNVHSSDSDEENEMSVVEEAIDVDTNLNGKDVDSKSVNKNNVRQKNNQLNLLDSSDDETSNGNVFVKNINHGEVIDITEGYQNVNTQFHKNNEAVIDITDGYTNKITTTTNNEMMAIDSNKNHETRSNIHSAINSSDEECDIMIVKESISAEIHDKAGKNENDELVIFEEDKNETCTRVNEVVDDRQTHLVNVSESDNKCVKDTEKESAISVLSNENIDSNVSEQIGDEIDEVMDIDFYEDF